MVRWLLQFIAIVLLLDGAVICMVSARLPGRGLTNEGNLFFVGFFRNRFGRVYEPEVIPPVIWITTRDIRGVSVSIFSIKGRIATVSVTPGNVTHFNVPVEFVVFDSNEKNVTDSRFKGIRIKAQGKRRIILFGQHEEAESNDAYLGLPVISRPPGSSYEYIVSSVFGYSGSARQAKHSVALIVGTENDTEIILEPSVVINHPFAILSGGRFGPGASVNTRTVTIQRFQTFYLQVHGKDISGTRIIANKPISVFSGHECASIPVSSKPCDMLIEQIAPIDTWGTEVVTIPLRTRNADVIKVFASHDSTTVSVTHTNISSGTVTSDPSFTLGRNQFRELVISDYTLIQSNNPIGVFQFSRSYTTDNVTFSDPFMLSVPSCKQYRDSYVVAPAPFDPLTVGTILGHVAYVNYINIAVPAEYFNASMIIVNNNPIDASKFSPIKRADNSVWGYGAQLLLAQSAQTIKHLNSNASLAVTLYGFSKRMSWGCIGGTSLDPISVVSFEFAGKAGSTIQVTESDDSVEIVLVLSNPASYQFTISVVTTGITATAGRDFGPSHNYAVTFPAGSKRQSVKIPIINDKVYELDETFQLEISIPEEVFAAGVIHGCHPIAPSITVDIFDDDDETNEGNEFFVGFFKNRFGKISDQEVIPPVIWITTRDTRGVRVSIFNISGRIATVFVTPGEVTRFSIPIEFVTADSVKYPSFKGIHIKAQGRRKIVLFGQHEEVGSNDAYLALPVISRSEGSSYEYIVSSVFGYSGNVQQAKDSVALIIGTEDDTKIILEPSTVILHPFAKLSDGKFIPGASVDTRTVTIQRFQTFYLQVLNKDMSGTRIIANKPISVFSGHECASIPLSSKPCDMLIEQIAPIDTWGTEVVTIPLMTRSADVIKVFASHDFTTVSVTHTDISSGMVTSNPSFTLGRNQFLDLVISDYTLIQSNNPIGVFQFSRSHTTDNVITSDPFMLSVPPCEQYRNSYAIAPAPFNETIKGTAAGRVAYVNYTNIAVPAKYFNVSMITVNNNSINASKFSPIKRADNSIWGYGTQLLLDEGAQIIKHQNPNAAMSVTMYGFSKRMSWGCTGGTGLISVSIVSFKLASGSDSTIQVTESDGSLEVDLVLSKPVDQEINVSVVATGLTAIVGEDFGPPENYIITFPAGSTQQTLNIPIINDNIFELDETFKLEINIPEETTAAGIRVGCYSFTPIVKITNDDPYAAEFFVGFFEGRYYYFSPAIVLTTTDKQPVFYSIEAPGIGYYKNGIIQTDGAVRVNLPEYAIVSSFYEQNKGIYIKTSSNKVTVQARPEYSCFEYCNRYCWYSRGLERFIVIPVTRLCVSEYVYYAISANSTSLHYNSSVLVVGTEDDTRIKVTVTQSVKIIADHVITNLVPYKEYSFTINRFQTVYFGSTGDLTGSKFVTNKEVSVFSGHQYGNVLHSPSSHMMKQVPPTFLWEKVHYVMPFKYTTESYAIKIVASDYCVLKFSCNSFSSNFTLNDGEYMVEEFLNNESCVIKSTAKVLITQFFLGTSYNYGSVIMTLIPPIKHYYNRFKFLLDTYNQHNYVNVLVLPEYYQPDKIYLVTSNGNTSLDTQVWVPINIDGIIEAYATHINVRYRVVEIFHTTGTALMSVMLYGAEIEASYGIGIPNYISKELPGTHAFAPEIITHPVDLIVTASSNAVFACSVRVCDLISFKWKRKNSDLPKKSLLSANNTTSILTIPNVTRDDVGEYYCIVETNNKMSQSNVARLQFSVRQPKLQIAPIPTIVYSGQTATFFCFATGYNVNYQWTIGSGLFPSKVTDVNNNMLVIPDVKRSDDNSYTCVASNDGGSVQSNATQLTVIGLPLVTVTPSIQRVEVTHGITLLATVTSTGIRNFSYQWRHNGTIINGETNNILIISDVTESDNGYYTCIISNNLISQVPSNIAQLIVTRNPPVILISPRSIFASLTTTVSLNCKVDSTMSSYYWEKENDTIPTNAVGMNTSILTLIDLQSEDIGNYRCVATNGSGTSKSKYATVTINTFQPVITEHPQNASIDVYTSVILKCTAKLFGKMQIYWQKVGSSRLPNTASLNVIKSEDELELTSVLRIANALSYYSGSYRCIVKNEIGEVYSLEAQLQVKVPCPEITSLPINITVLPGKPSQFTCKAFSFHHLKYEWKRKDFAELSTEVTTSLKLDEQDLTAYTVLGINKTGVAHEGWYCCVVTNECGDVEECAWLEVDTSPVINKQPESVVIGEYNETFIECLAYGIGPIYYEWKKYWLSNDSWIIPPNGINITSPKLIFYAITEEDEGIYHCVAFNDDGAVISDNATITVYGPPIITFITEHKVAFEGSKARLLCNATNDIDAIHPLQIIWYNSSGKEVQQDKSHLIHNINDTTTVQLQSILLFDPVNRTDSEEYKCRAFNHPKSYIEAKSKLTIEYIRITPQSPHTVSVGDTVSLWCRAIGLSTPTVQWYQNDKPVKPHAEPLVQVLEVPTSTQHTTVYTCVARNFTANVNHTITDNIIVIVQANCPELQSPANGKLQYIGDDRLVAAFECNAGYTRDGPLLVHCIGGTWNMSPPVCEKTP